jgi:AraC-like DNA-binding protein
MISVAATMGLTDAIAAAGGRPEHILRSVGLDGAVLADPHRFIACADFTRLLEAAAQATGDQCFGLHFGEHFLPKNIGPLAYVVLNSPTFAEGFQNVARYVHVHNQGMQASFEVEGQWAYVRARLIDPPPEPPRQYYEFAAAVGLNLIRLMAGSQWAPAEVHFGHPAPADTSEHTRVFSSPVSFQHGGNAFMVERAFAARPVAAADERLYEIMRRYLDRIIEEMPSEASLPASVRKVVAESMRDGHPSLHRVANKLARSPRTLQRRLHEHTIDFKALVADTRRRFAVTYLRDPNHTMTEIAFLLGYSEVSAFDRAFKRWTGSTPSNYRKKEVGQ